MDIGDRSGNPSVNVPTVMSGGLTNWEGRVGCANKANEDLSSPVPLAQDGSYSFTYVTNVFDSTSVKIFRAT